MLTCLAVAVDGDTLRCGGEYLRLVGIDAPEIGGRCRPGRSCANGDPLASKQNLENAVQGKSLVVLRLGRDRYGRTIAAVRVDGRDLSCHQLDGGMADYVPQWDNQRTIWNACRKAVRRSTKRVKG